MIVKLYLAKNGSREAYRELHQCPFRYLQYQIFLDGMFVESVGPWETVVWNEVKKHYEREGQ